MNPLILEERKVKMLKEAFPKGTRVCCIEMNDQYSPVESGTFGTVDFVDDAGTIHMKWDNGRTLGLVYGEDKFRKLSAEEIRRENNQSVLGDECTIVLPDKPIDYPSTDILDELEYECWGLVKSYCAACGIEMLTDENGEIPISFDIAKGVQGYILNQLKMSGLTMNSESYDVNKVCEKLKEMSDSDFSDANVLVYDSIHGVFDYFFDEELSKSEIVDMLTAEQKLDLLSQFDDRFLQLGDKFYCYNEGFYDFEEQYCESDNQIMDM